MDGREAHGMLGLQEGEAMSGRRKPVGDTEPSSTFNVNRVPFGSAEYKRIKAWCDGHGMRIGVLVATLLREWMDKEGI